MKHEESQVRFDEDSAGCCQLLFCNLRKKLDFIVVCVLLLIVLLSVILALYHGIRLKEFSSVAIGFGIWLPSIVLGMVCVYTAFTCLQKSTITTSHFTSDGNSVLSFQSNQETRLDIVRNQPEIRQESPEIPLQVSQESKKHPKFRNCEDLPSEQSSKLDRKKHFRSLSSSNLNRYNSKHNLRVKNYEECGYSRDRVDRGEYTSRNKSQQEEPNPRRRNFRRSLSETRAVKHEDLEFARSASHDNALLHSPEMYKERKYLSQMKEYDNSNFYHAVAEESWRENFKKHSIRKNGDFLKYKYGTDNLSAGEYIEGNEHPLQFQTYYPQGISAFQNYSSKTPCQKENRHLQRIQTEFSENLGGIKKYPSKCTEKSGNLHQFQANSQGSIGEILKYPSKKRSTQENRHLQQYPSSTGFPKNRSQNYSSKVPSVERNEHLMRFQRDSSKNISGVKQYSLKKPSLTIEGNGNQQQFQTDCPESMDAFKKYPTKLFCMPIFKPSRAIYDPQGNALMSHAVPRNINYLQNNQNEKDYPPRNGYEKNYQYESNEMSNGLLGETRTHHNRTDRIFRGDNGVDVQFSRAGINGFQSLQDIADIGYLSNVKKNTRNILPVNRSNVEINSSNHMETRELLPFSYLQPTSQINCFPQTENNSQVLGHSMLKRRSPREKSKISDDSQNNTGLSRIADWDSTDNSYHI